MNKIKQSIEKSINKQINAEEFSARLYKSMASWCDVNGFPGCAKFFWAHGDEEMEHMMRFVKYLNNRGGHALFDAVEKPQQEFKNITEIFELANKHEEEVTKMINDMYEIAEKEKDHATSNMLQWFIAEQVEEEALFGECLDIIKCAGKTNIFLADQAIAGKE